MDAILGAEARVFMDLTEEGELKPYAPIALANALELGIDPGELEFHRFPIRDALHPLKSRRSGAPIETLEKGNSYQ